MPTFNINPNCLELIKSGKCKADCCGVVPILEQYWKRLKKYAQTNDYTIFKFKYKGDTFIKALTKNFKCVFLNSDNLCSIHDHHLRSEVCKIFGFNEKEPLLACPHINENKKDYISNYADDFIKKLANTGEPASIEYLNRKVTNHTSQDAR